MNLESPLHGRSKLPFFRQSTNSYHSADQFTCDFVFSVLFMADPGTEDFECSVKWTTGIIDTVLLTELILPFNLHLEWRHDSAWRGVLLRSIDWATLEVEWENNTTNIVEIEDVSPLNVSVFIGEEVYWKEDNTKGEIIRIERLQVGDTVNDFNQNSENVMPTEPSDDQIEIDTESHVENSAAAENSLIQEQSNIEERQERLRLRDFAARSRRPTVSSSESESDEAGDESSSEGGVSSDEDNEENLPLGQIENNGSARSWRVLRGERLPECEFIEHYHGVFGVKTPLQYFEQYFTDDFINEMCYKAVHYRVTKDPNSTFTVSAAEMRTYLGVVLYMTLVKLGGVRRYWCSSTRINLIADVITRDRFEAITKSLHFETETPSPTVSAKTKKFQRIVDQFNDVAATIYLEENLSVDEQIIAYKGRKSSLRQYNPRKPKKWGWKVFVLSGRLGIIHKPVTVLSTFCAGEPEVSLRRYDRVSKTHVAVQAPQSISVYNKHMGYVDEINSYLGRFRVTTHFRTRAYLKIFLNFVNIIATNCWAQYRRDAEREGDGKKDTMSLYVFKSLLAESLCKTKASRPGRRASLDEIPIKRPRPGPKSTLPMADIRLDRTGHWPIGIGSSMRGGNCKMPGCKSKPVTKCEKCDVHLCVAAKNCFKVFHTVERL